MIREVIVSEKSVEAAIELGCRQLEKERDDVEYEILEMPKKGLFGKIKSEAKVRVYFDDEEEDILAAVREEAALRPKRKPEAKTEPKAPRKEVPAAPAAEEAPAQKAAQPETSAQPADKPAKKAAKAISPELRAKKLAAAQEYIHDVLAAMGITGVNQVVDESEEGAVITLEGDDLGVIIGRRGETLDAFQYLVSLVCNKVGGDYYRLTIDCGNFREKREQTLKELAAKIARTVLKTGRSCTLEPMNPYERRIIHSVIAETEGVSSKSIGEEPHRKVVVTSDNPRRDYRRDRNRRPRDGRRNNRYDDRRYDDRRDSASDTQAQEPSSRPESEPLDLGGDGKLYSKIEL